MGDQEKLVKERTEKLVTAPPKWTSKRKRKGEGQEKGRGQGEGGALKERGKKHRKRREKGWYDVRRGGCLRKRGVEAESQAGTTSRLRKRNRTTQKPR